MDFPVPLGDADEGVFRTFPQVKKSAKVGAPSRSELAAHSSSSTPGTYGVVSSLEEPVQSQQVDQGRAVVEDRAEWRVIEDSETDRPFYYNLRTLEIRWTLPPGASLRRGRRRRRRRRRRRKGGGALPDGGKRVLVADTALWGRTALSPSPWYGACVFIAVATPSAPGKRASGPFLTGSVHWCADIVDSGSGMSQAGSADNSSRAVFLSIVAWPTMFGITAVMDQKDYCTFYWQWHVQGLFCWPFHLAMCSLPWLADPDAQLLGRYEPEGLFRVLHLFTRPLCATTGYDASKEMSRAVEVKKPQEAQKAKALWKMKAAKDAGEEYYDPERDDNIRGRNETRLALWKAHLKDPIVALDEALKCVENSYERSWAECLVEGCLSNGGRWLPPKFV